MNNDITQNNTVNPIQNWRGLGGWNYYFWLKFALLWYGVLNFHPLTNLEFLAFLLFPLPSLRLHRWRNWIALPIGLVLFYYDTWLPGFSSIMSQGGNLADFSGGYLLELVNRFINWQMIGVAFILLVAYLFISEWVRLTLINVLILVWLNIVALTGFTLSNTQPNTQPNSPPTTITPTKVEQPTISENLPPTNANLNAYLNQFYEKEKQRITKFPMALPADAEPFDILIIQICSMAWSDLYASNLDKHPLLSHFDLLFTEFNTAASYSGPAAIRLLRGSCGQPKHADLYKTDPPQCFLMDNLAKLGFKSELVLDHDGQFGNFLTELRDYGDLHAPLMSQKNIDPEMLAFNDKPIYNDAELLKRWLEQLKQSNTQKSVTFFNVIAMHDGNRLSGQNTSATYPEKGQKLFDSIDGFFKNLEQSGRKVMVVVIPEHGMNLTGDKLQMSGLRDLPSITITHVPVGIKFIGMKSPFQGKPLQITAPSSYLALSDLIARVVDGKIFDEPTVNWQALVQNLPQTDMISENEGIVVMRYQGRDYIRLSGDSNWTPYPK